MPLMNDVQVPYVEQAAITVDAIGEEPSWRQAQRITGFRTFDPSVNEPATGETEVWLLADGQALYLRFVAHDPEPERIRASMGRRDTRWNDDFVGLYLDAAGEGQRSTLFGINAAGALMDGTRVAGSNGDDLSWDGIWQAEARITDTGWEAELAIPWRILRHPADCDQLGLFLFRYIARVGERSSWPLIDQDISGLLVQQALVGGPGALPPSRNLDLVPELAFGWSESGPANHRLGFNGFFPGVTARWSPTPSSSLLGTINPDFSQVESDAAQVDVNRRYALYYDEKRPFFLEGREWFEHSFGELVYTRSMVLPVYGARSTVEQGPWTVAALHSLDALPSPSVSEGGGWTEADLEGHLAAESVLRARRSVGDGSHVGLLLSDREILGTDLGNRLTGFDTRVRLTDQISFEGAALTSQTRFSDSATSWVPALKGDLEYSDETWHGGVWGWQIDPGFRAENGYITDADQRGGGAWGGATLRPGWKAMPSVSLTPLNLYAMWTTEGQLRDFSVQPASWFQLGNGAGVFVRYRHGGTLWQDTWLVQRSPVLWIGEAWTEWLEAELYMTTGLRPYYDADDPRSVWITDVDPGVTLRPWPWLAVGGTASWQQAQEDGTELYRGWVGRARLDVFASRQLWMRLIADRSTFSEARSAEALVAWEKAPGRAVYLGGRVDLPPQGSDVALAWQLQGKVSWVFAL
jgi:hypothetical protein